MSKKDTGIIAILALMIGLVIGLAITPSLIKWQREREIASVEAWEGTEGKIYFDPDPNSQGENKISSGSITISIEKGKKAPEGKWVVEEGKRIVLVKCDYDNESLITPALLDKLEGIISAKARQVIAELEESGAVDVTSVWHTRKHRIEVRYREPRFFNLGMNAEPWGYATITIRNKETGQILIDNQCTPLYLPKLREKTRLQILFTPNESKEVKEYWAYIEKEEQLLKGPPVSIAIWRNEEGEKK